VFPKTTKYSHSKLADPQIILIETQSGVRIDVEVFVNCKYGYDIQCSVVGEEGVANLPEPQSLLTRQSGKLASSILQDWKQRFIDAYDVELQEFIEDAVSGSLRGPNAWDGFSAAVASDACILAQQSGEIVPVSMPDKPDFYN
jgi:myo-inositol 2-dehydrogenase/D-chiro-inositol 1-dehydrogenase